MTMSRPAWWPLWAAEIATAAQAYGLAVNVLGALVWQESNGGCHPRSGEYTLLQLYRYEPGFWTRYLAGKPEYAPPVGVEASPLALEAWKRRVSASYGLCHVMYATARDHGFPATAAPERLLVPEVGLQFGVKILKRHLDRTGDLTKALLAYNGGGRPAYADEVADKVSRLVQAGV